MDRKNLKTYWFDFNGAINEQLPLSYNILKICKKEIDNMEKNNNYFVSTKEKPIKIQLNFNQKYNTECVSEIDNNMYEKSNKNSFLSNIGNHLYSLINLVIQPINILLEFKLNYLSSKLNIKHYYIINNKLYITYKNSLILFNSHNDYINDIKKINNVKYNFIYRNRININTSFYDFIDTMFIKIILYTHLNYLKIKHNNRLNYRLKQTDWGFYIKNNNNIINNLIGGIKFIWKGLRFWLIGLLLGVAIIYYLMYIRLLPFNKIILSWILVAMFLYWLISGFVFFIKKYQYSRFTAAIQRFWKRTYIIFWLIEAGTFSVFFYLTLNSSSEPVYMYDQIKIFKNNLFSWRWFLIKLLPSVSIILLGYYLQITLKWNLFNKQSTILFLITIILLYILWLEFYQFFHILSFYGNISWLYDYDEYIWTLEIDTRRTRLANNYISICLFAKFWHFVFITVFWIFFVLRINELGRIRYPLLVANVQNFIIIYIMSWAYMYPWLKFIFRKYLDVPYYWFFTNGRKLGIRVFFTDLKLFFYGITSNLFNFNINFIKFDKYPFYYWINASNMTDFNQYRKFIIRDSIIHSLNNYVI
uniref:Ymf68 n=1 Tax=Tetrahymena rostrata TaxID=5909 RepID=A0A650DE98_TETRO|nr:Ymf68 [Tetrahymena rostrata]QGS65283.1 Ymf68 [Tetrahymena rostrata]